MDSMKAYLKDIRPIPLLTAKQEVELAKLIQEGDDAARDKMIRSNLRLVISIAKRYVNLGIPINDLIEEGNIGLMRGVQKFDHTRGFRFSTYASWWIKQSISRAIIDQGKMIRVPVYMNEEIFKYKKATEALTHTLKRKPEFAEVAKKMKLTVDRVRELEGMIAKMSSLDAPIGESGEGNIKDIIEDENVISPDEELEEFFNKERAMELMKILVDRERKIIEMRYGLSDGNARTLAEIAKVLGVSRERIRQIENVAINKIKQELKKSEKGMEKYD
ncbi:RNA polymerase sigma factor RpoD [hydrothermal vent metagenome]|uniref:RNA polymerase sigma factor RpoD n=1 Tax=hydrothermal vent metagenome TaxID=652676 RepID=A0A3B1DC03_9ZZZZ